MLSEFFVIIEKKNAKAICDRLHAAQKCLTSRIKIQFSLIRQVVKFTPEVMCLSI